jgi:signal transduction histidine kinase
MSSRVSFLVPLTAVLAGCATVLVALVPGLSFAYWSPSVHAAVETAAALISALLAYVVALRFRRSGSIGDLCLVVALGTLATTNIAFSAVPALAGGFDSASFVWVRMVGRMLSAAMLTAAAFTPDVRLRRAGRTALLSVAGVAAALALIAVAASQLGLPAAPSVDPTFSDVPRIEALNLMIVLQTCNMALFILAAAGFAGRARRGRDELIAWLAIGSVLSAFARLHYLLFPSTASDWIFTRDILTLGFYLVLVVGALRELSSHQREAAVEAVLKERERVAHVLHDRVAQELAFISMQTRRLAERDGGQAVKHIAEAADRALSESREAIAVLMRSEEESLDAAISRVAEELTSRSGARLRLSLDPRVELSPERQEHLVQIVREAVWNGLHHGGATAIAIELSVDHGMRLEVSDNGCGFDAAAVPRERRLCLGLVSMKERARILGGELRISSAPGSGTVVEAVLP